MNIRSMAEDLLGLLFPPTCHVCGLPLPQGSRFICPGCRADLPLASYAPERNPMTEALLRLPRGLDGTAFLRYAPGNSVAALVHDFKYNGFSRLARHLGQLAGRHLLPSGFFDGVDVLLPVPLHRFKEMRRGYNQARMIALGISDTTGVPTAGNLRAPRRHPTQTRLDHEARRANVEGIFAVSRPGELEGMRVLIVDDVFTTGATLMSAAETVSADCRGVSVKIFALSTAHI